MKKIIIFILTCFMLVACDITNNIKMHKNIDISTVAANNYISLIIHNKFKNKVIEIIWDKSRINDSSCFLKGKYVDAKKPQLSEILAPKELKLLSIYPSDNIYYNDSSKKWKISEIKYPAKLVLCLRIDNREKFFIKEIYKLEKDKL